MGKPIRALLVEDSKVAALAVVRELERGGFDVTSKRVETKEEFINALSNEEWDVVISDYVLPGLNGAEALDLLHQKGKDLPFIMVSGTIIEDVAVEIMKRGVHDYVMKDNLARLCPVVMREVKDARVRHEKKSSEEQLKWQLELMKTITDNAASCLFMMDVKGHPTFMNPAAEKVTGYTLDKIKDKPLHDSVHYKYPDGRPYPMSECPIDNAQAELTEMKNYEDVFTKEDGTLYSVVCYLAPLTLGGKVFGSVLEFRDITESKKEEANLRRLATVVLDSNDAITIQDLDGNITAWNRGAEKMYGWSEEEALKMNSRDTVPADKKEEALLNIVRVEEEEEVPSIETQRVTKDGRTLDVWLTVTRLVDGLGEIVAVATTERDITERKKKEANLRRLATVVLDSNDAITIQDLDGNITAWNRGAEKMYGWSEEEALKMNSRDTVPEDKKEEALLNIVRVVEEEVPSIETQRVTKDGRTLDVWLTVTRLVDDLGEIVAVATTERDITERKKKEEEILAIAKFPSENPSPVMRIAEDGTILYSNENGLKILTGWDTKVGSKAPKRWCRLIGERIDTGKTGKEEEEEEEEGKIFSVMIAPVKEAGYTNLYFRDITENKKAEEEIKKLNQNLEHRIKERTRELQEKVTEVVQSEEKVRRYAAQLQAANQELEAFSYSVSHDLRAPLRSMDGFSRILLDTCQDKLDDDSKDNLMRVRKASQKMAQLIEDILTLSRVARKEIKKEHVDLTRIAEEVVSDLRKEDPSRQVEAVVQSGLSAGGDQQLIRLVLDNLLANAWKFTSKTDKAKIEMGKTPDDKENVFFARDNGAGFEMQYADKLFGAFQRLHSEKDFPGTGIGLASVKRIISRHGGRVWAEGDVGKGATFYFTLP